MFHVLCSLLLCLKLYFLGRYKASDLATSTQITMSQDLEITPDESISQIMADDFINEYDVDDIYGTSSSTPRFANRRTNIGPSSSISGSSFGPSTQGKLLYVTVDNVDEAKSKISVDILDKDANRKEEYKSVHWRCQSKFIRKSYWEEYDEVVDLVDKAPKLRCKHCLTLFLHPTRSSHGTTTAIKRHIESRCPKYKLKNKQSTTTQSGTGFFSGSSKPSSDRPVKITKDFLEEQILKFFVSGNIPFNQADNEHFQRLMSFIPINDKPATSPSRTTLRARLSKYSELAVQDLKDVLTHNESKISLALDCWSSRSRQGYLGMFVTYIRAF
jgi:hypothetical protein